MKKLILSIAAIVAFTFSGYAQCTPDPQYMDSTYGAWPDTITDFPAGQVAVPYSEVLDFKVPADAGEIDPLFSGTPRGFSCSRQCSRTPARFDIYL